MARIQILAAALVAGALALGIPAVPNWPDSGRCTDKSLTIPSWLISDYEVVAGTTTFKVNNRASEKTPYSADVECTPEGVCHGSGIAADALRETISTGPDGNPVIGLTETWVCGDNSDKVFFQASGNTSITQCAGGDCVSPIPYLVPGSLKLPVPLTPAQPTPPPGYKAPTCASVGPDQWTVTGVSYKNYPKGQCKQWYLEDRVCLDSNTGNFTSKGQYLSLNVTNNAIEYEVACSHTPKYNDFDIPSPLRCTGGKFNDITLDVSWSGTAPDFTLKIEELWYCLENPSTNVEPTVIVASGSEPIALACESHTGITGAADDIITTCTDPVDSHAVAGTQTAKETLPAFSLDTAYPVQGGCTFDSVVSPTFYMRGMFFETTPFEDPSTAELSRFTCGLTGPGFADYFFYQKAPISGAGVGAVYDCGSHQLGCTYSFHAPDRILTLDKVWECSEKNAAQPLYFNGQGEYDWNMDPYSQCSSPNNNIYCYWYDNLATLQPGVPYNIPKVTVSLVNGKAPQLASATRENGTWSLLNN
ncbi:uncharacterized protein PG986_001465 [Apiospora aurea]|uniref:Uncharacterized protein n=1 Tax=Apiospora aurea TaxID=335848 RepID=A0ABR1QXL9_9PEZI